jgi:transposase
LIGVLSLLRPRTPLGASSLYFRLSFTPAIFSTMSTGRLMLAADMAFDSNAIIADLNQLGAKVVIAQHPRRAAPLPIDAALYKWRHLIENFFGKLKEFKRIAMRADKTDQSFKAAIHLAAAVISSR